MGLLSGLGFPQEVLVASTILDVEAKCFRYRGTTGVLSGGAMSWGANMSTSMMMMMSKIQISDFLICLCSGHMHSWTLAGSYHALSYEY